MATEEETKEEVQSEVVGEEATSAAKDEDDKPPAADVEKVLATPEAIAAITERLKFFFGNANVRQDNFVRKLLMEKNSIPVDTLLKFNSIKALTNSPCDIIKAAESLPGILKVSEDKKNIGRVDPFTESLLDGHIPLSLYLKDVPHEDGTYKITVQEVRDFFGQYGTVAIIKLGFHSSRNRARKPNGSCLVEFEDAASLEKAAAEVVTSKDGAHVEPSRTFMVGSHQIQILTLQDHIEQNKKGEEEKREEGNDEGGVEEFKVDWKKGCVIKLAGLSGDCDREAILAEVAKALAAPVDDVKKEVYVDFSRGQADGAVRFQEPSDKVTELCQKLADGVILIAGSKVTSAKVLEGDEEEKYWEAFIEFKKKQRRLKSDDNSGRRKKRQRRG